jgi:hypothetical protein
MKRRQIHKLLSLMLTFAVMFGMIGVITLPAEANTPPIASGVYFIRNTQTGKYLEVPHGGGNGTWCGEFDFRNEAHFRWRVTHLNNIYIIDRCTTKISL